MNSRVIVALVGVFTVVFGLLGLFLPFRTMQFAGFGFANPDVTAGTLGEVRAVYGGLLIAAGALTLLSATDPRANQSRLMVLGILWLSICAGRLFGVVMDGNPGVIGWFNATLELGGGLALLAAPYFSESTATSEAPGPYAG